MNRQQRAEVAERVIARFAELKQDENWTQDTLTKESGVPDRTVSDVLRRVSVPNGNTLAKLCAAMGIEVDPSAASAKRARYEWFFNVLAMYLDDHCQTDEERDAVMEAQLRHLFRDGRMDEPE